MCGLYSWSLNFRRWDLAWTVSVPPSWGLGAVEVKMTRGRRSLRFVSVLAHIVLFLGRNSVF